ncbi:hypothetical protein [Actinoplanes sp. NPDC051859]|uniref:hypothetical protein n=1 Tax=Actinoplanes sp. NPDC051859 TaxID=3363909 RepID=UPI0037AD4762
MTDLPQDHMKAIDKRAALTPGEFRWGMPQYHRARVPLAVADLRAYDNGRLTVGQVLGRNYAEVYRDSKLVARMWLYRQVMTHLRLSKLDTALNVGDEILTWHLADSQDKPVAWNGPDENESTTFKMQTAVSRQQMRVWCPAESAAPAWLPLTGDKDSRILVEKLTKPAPWLGGPWRLTVPSPEEGATHEKWCATKHDAMAYARLWRTVLDYHDAVTGYFNRVTEQFGRFPR